MKESAVSFCHPTSRSAFATRCDVFVHPVFDTPYRKPLDDTGVALDEVIAGQRFSIDLVSAIAVEAVGCRVRCDGDARLPCDTASVTDCARSSKTSSGQAISGAKPPSSPGHQIAVGHYRPQRAVDLRTCTNHFRQGRCPDRRDHELLEIQGGARHRRTLRRPPYCRSKHQRVHRSEPGCHPAMSPTRPASGGRENRGSRLQILTKIEPSRCILRVTLGFPCRSAEYRNASQGPLAAGV